MSGYIVEEPESCPVYYNSDGNIKYLITSNINDYWLEYSPIQKKRFKKVLHQLKNTWYDVFNQMNFIHSYSSIEDCNSLMVKIHKIFLIEHKSKIQFYNEEKIKLRKNKNYISKKINKLKNTKSKL
jgi:hypothetical protein